jgi:hypothetical protein
MTNYQISINIFTELMTGYVLPGRPIAIIMFDTWGCVPTYQALAFIMDLKVGHYMKIPPRSMFFCQIVGTVVAGTVQLGVQEWMFSHVEDICSPNQKDNFICPLTNVLGSASIIVSHYSCGHFVSPINVFPIVGCCWATTYLLARSAVLRPHLLLPGRCCCAAYPVDSPEEV